jgi:hypothetical protein
VKVLLLLLLLLPFLPLLPLPFVLISAVVGGVLAGAGWAGV